jgi:phosphoribosylamine-glycine ligase
MDSHHRVRALIVGSGPLEHALAARIAASDHTEEVVVAPGNEGIGRELPREEIALPLEARALADLARSIEAGLVVLGEVEAPPGLAESLRAEGLLVVTAGGSAAEALPGAALEGTTLTESARRALPVLQGGTAEVSVKLAVLTDGRGYLVLPAVERDGAVAFAPARAVSEEQVEALRTQLVEPLLFDLHAAKVPYRGFLTLSLLVQEGGAVAFEGASQGIGALEAAALIPALDEDLARLLRDAAAGHLARAGLADSEGAGAAALIEAEPPAPGDEDEGIYLLRGPGSQLGVTAHAPSATVACAQVTATARRLRASRAPS